MLCVDTGGSKVGTAARPSLPSPPPPQHPRGLTNVLEVQVIVEKLVLLEVGVLRRVHVVLDVVLDLADGVHQDGVVVQHAQDGLEHAHVVAVLLDVALQALDPVLLLLASPGQAQGRQEPQTPQNPDLTPLRVCPSGNPDPAGLGPTCTPAPLNSTAPPSDPPASAASSTPQLGCNVSVLLNHTTPGHPDHSLLAMEPGPHGSAT